VRRSLLRVPLIAISSLIANRCRGACAKRLSSRLAFSVHVFGFPAPSLCRPPSALWPLIPLLPVPCSVLRAPWSLPLAPSSVPLIPSPKCAAFTEKSELTTGGSLPLSRLPPVPVPTLIPNPLLDPLLLALCSPAQRSDHVLNRPGLGIRSPLDCDEPAASS
jgi:hypothetical protein